MAMSRPLLPRWPASNSAQWTSSATASAPPCVLGAAALGAPFRRIALYEPPGPQATQNNWPERVAAIVAAGQAGRATFTFLARVARQVRQPVLLLGTASPPWAGQITRELAAVLPAATVTELPGAGHDALDTAPDLLVTEVLRFLRDEAPP